MHRVSIAAEDVIYRQGDVAAFAYLLLSGAVAMERDGAEVPAAPGAVIGLSALVQMPYGATARAKAPSDLLVFTRRELRGIIRSDPDRALQIIDGIIDLVAAINRVSHPPAD